MNVLFYTVMLLCTAIMLVTSPQTFLSTLLGAASKSATLCISLLATYSVWLGLMQVWQACGLSQKLSRLLRPISKRFFHVDDTQTLDAITMNLSVNVLGISGAATPYGIQAAKLLDKTDEAEYASCMLFALNATSIQLIPTSIIGVRTALGSATPADIVLPTIIVSFLSTFLACLLVRLFIPPKSKRISTEKRRLLQKNKGACI
ncbi:MAG: spore maturation protein [Clostridia bacterium]|nr:spore maturation protein [Clostridia bacterium]